MPDLFRDTGQPLDVRVDDLLRRLTLREKVGQLNQRLLGWHAWSRTAGGVRTTDALDTEVDHWGGLGRCTARSAPTRGRGGAGPTGRTRRCPSR